MSLLATFRSRFPEFKGVQDDFVQGYLTAAEVECDSVVWGNYLTEGQIYLAADKMARTPFGQKNAMVDKKTGKTIYGLEYDRLTSIVTSGYRVVRCL